MAELNILATKIKNIPNSVQVKLIGVVDVTTEDQLSKKIDSLVKSGYARFLIDLQGLSFMNSNGFATLVALSDKLRELGGSLVLNNATEEIIEMSNFLGLREFFQFAESSKDAASKLKRVRNSGMYVPVPTQSESDPELRLQSLGPSPAPSPYEASIRKTTQKLRRSKTEIIKKEENVERIVTVQYIAKVELHKHYPLRIIINKAGIGAQPTSEKVTQITGIKDIKVLGINPCITIVPKFDGCLVNPGHMNLDLIHENIEYTFWVMPHNSDEIKKAKVQVYYGKETLEELIMPLQLEVKLL